MRRLGFLAWRVSLFASLVATLGGLVTWALYDWSTAWITFVCLFGLCSVTFVSGQLPKASRASRLLGAGLWLTCATGGVLLVLGVPDHAHQGIGWAILGSLPIQLWERFGAHAQPLIERGKTVLFRLFGGPDVGWFESDLKPDLELRAAEDGPRVANPPRSADSHARESTGRW